jgi:hypothetical protein
MEETGEPGENHRPVSSHWQIVSQHVVHLALIGLSTMDLTIQDIFNPINEGLHIFQKLCMKYFSCVELKFVEVYI